MTSLEDLDRSAEGGHAEATNADQALRRKSAIARGMQECHEDLLETMRELDRTLLELENEQGILERWFGYRTSV